MKSYQQKGRLLLKGIKNYKEEQEKLENSFAEMNPVLKAMNSRMNLVEERISDLDDRLVKDIQYKEHTERQKQKKTL